MKRLYIYIIMCGLFLTACRQDIPEAQKGEALLELDLLRAGRPVIATRAVADGLAVSVFKEDGTLFKSFPAGEVPDIIVLEPGTFTVRAYSPNQDGAWKAANGGKGEGCYFAEATVEMEYDAVTRLKLDVPLTNYAVSLQLPDMFDILFNPASNPFPGSYTFTLASGGRTVTIKEGERAYFDVADHGFSYALQAINNDETTHQHSAINYTDVAAGNLYTVRYAYSTDANSGGVVIVITDDMEKDDNDIDL